MKPKSNKILTIILSFILIPLTCLTAYEVIDGQKFKDEMYRRTSKDDLLSVFNFFNSSEKKKIKFKSNNEYDIENQYCHSLYTETIFIKKTLSYDEEFIWQEINNYLKIEIKDNKHSLFIYKDNRAKFIYSNNSEKLYCYYTWNSRIENDIYYLLSHYFGEPV